MCLGRLGLGLTLQTLRPKVGKPEALTFSQPEATPKNLKNAYNPEAVFEVGEGFLKGFRASVFSG